MEPKEGGASRAASDSFHILLGRALVDEDYRTRLRDASQQVDALKEAGIHNPTEQQIQQLNSAITAVTTLAGTFSEETGAA